MTGTQSVTLQQDVHQDHPFGAMRATRIRLDSKTDMLSLCVCAVIFTAWAACLCTGLTQVQLGSTSWLTIAVLAWLVEYLYMGLFITAHDAMHGIVCRSNPRLNKIIGRIAVVCYAWFDFANLHEKHWQHHRNVGKVGRDPDFHTGNPSMWPWFAAFMASYITPRQLACITAQTAVLLVTGVPFFNVLLFTAVCPIASALQLFFFGTYLPHKPDTGVQDWPEERSRTTDAPAWLTMLQCYNFGLHLEHHAWPAVPWYLLPAARQQWRALQASGKCNSI